MSNFLALRKYPFLLITILPLCLTGQSPAAGRINQQEQNLIDPTLVTTEPGDGAVRLYNFLKDNYGRKIISGVMTLNSFDETQWLKTNTGKEPALVGLDFMHCNRGYTWYNDNQPIDDAKAYYNRNGIPALCWHWRDPSRKTEEFYTNKTTFDISKIFETNSAEYDSMISDIDYIAGLLKQLNDENIPVIWRPLHEAAGGWFWWGAKGAAPCKKLYQVMFDRMVNHHGLKNLIWVWTREPNDDAWYPGDEYIDIVGRDIYKDGDHSSQVSEFSTLKDKYSNKKMITLSECGSFPDPDNLKKDGARWSWFMPWYGSFVKDSKYNSLDLWKKTMAHDYVITLDEMPDLRTYEAAPVTSVGNNIEKALDIYPTIVDDSLTIDTKNRSGRVVVFDALGKVMYTAELKAATHVISFSGMTPGLYFVKINEQTVSKIIKR
jgi:mannan endo-1,4-beta-mannosidase